MLISCFLKNISNACLLHIFQPCSDIAISFSDILDQLIENDCLHVSGVSIRYLLYIYTG